MRLSDLLESLATPKEFKAQPHLCSESDTLVMYFEDTGSYARRVDKVLTVYKSFDNDEVVGFELKGVLGKMKELGSMISVVTAETPKVHVKLLIMTYRQESMQTPEPYDDIMRKSETFEDAKLPVLV